VGLHVVAMQLGHLDRAGLGHEDLQRPVEWMPWRWAEEKERRRGRGQKRKRTCQRSSRARA
jgi:hypothetical protein